MRVHFDLLSPTKHPHTYKVKTNYYQLTFWLIFAFSFGIQKQKHKDERPVKSWRYVVYTYRTSIHLPAFDPSPHMSGHEHEDGRVQTV